MDLLEYLLELQTQLELMKNDRILVKIEGQIIKLPIFWINALSQTIVFVT